MSFCFMKYLEKKIFFLFIFWYLKMNKTNTKLLEFIYESSAVIGAPDTATANARFRSLEIVSTTVVWLIEKEYEIYDAFAFPKTRNNVDNLIKSDEAKKDMKEKLAKALNDFHAKMAAVASSKQF